MGFQGMRKSTVLPNAQSRPPRATPASIARRRRPQHGEFPTGYSLAGCSPAEPASASPAAPVYVRRPVRHNQLRCPHFLSPSASISRLRNQHTACHSRAPSRQTSETEHLAGAVSSLGTRQAYLDGELCGVFPDGITSFTSRPRPTPATRPGWCISSSTFCISTAMTSPRCR